MDTIAIIYTTFLRDNLMYKTIQSIVDNWIDNYVLLIGDQNIPDLDKISYFYTKFDIGIRYFNLPFDCGLSFDRNYLVEQAYKLEIPYCLISADSIEFTDKYNFQPIIDFIKSRNNNAIVGLKLANRQPFEYDMTIDKELGKFILDRPAREKRIYEGISYQRCDIVKNFFIAPTELLYKHKWLPELKLCEHETFFHQLKENNVEVYFTDKISANYIDDKPPEYLVMRKRLYSEFVTKMREINGMAQNPTGWLEYS